MKPLSKSRAAERADLRRLYPRRADQAFHNGTRRDGRSLTEALVRLVTRAAAISTVEDIGGRLRLVGLSAPALEGFEWKVGQKVQIGVSGAVTSRTFTPMRFDSATGSFHILGFAHGSGPGSDWISRATPGQACRVMGPRPSLNMEDLLGQIVIFGDETSIGLCVAVEARRAARSTRCLIEADAPEELAPALGRLGLEGTEMYARTSGETHLDTVAARLADMAARDVHFVLTGKAGSIQRLRQALRTLAVPSRHVLTKAYWAPGKVGLE